MALNYVTITETFKDGSGAPLSPVVTFTPSQAVYSAGNLLATPATPIVATIVNGALKAPGGSVPLTLLATDNAGLSYQGGTGFFFWTVTVNLGGGVTQTWNFFLPSTPTTVDLYALANTVAGGGFTNPMTTLGDTIYEDGTPTAVRLPGNTAATRKFLRQLGTGSVSAAPAWDTLLGSDLPHGDWLKPWQFRPEDYGAKGDGKIVSDVVTNATTTITSATATFTAADVGKHIMINGANGTGAAPLMTTISSVTNSTTAVLASAASASQSGCAAVYGTDDTAAINSAISAAQTYALANNYLAEVLLADRIYVSTSLTQASTPAVVNSQVPVPYPAQNGLSRKLMFTIRGAGKMAPAQYWESTTPNVQGSAIVSMLTAPSTLDPTFQQQSVIGGPSGNAGFTGGFANTHLTCLDFSIWCPAFTNIKALDMSNLSGCHLDGYSSNIFAPANNLSAATAAHPYLSDLPASSTFQNSIGIGIWFPAGLNNDSTVFGSIAVEGYEVGVQAQDHCTGDRLAALYCDVILRIDGGGSLHEVSIRSVSAEVYNGGIRVTGAGGHWTRLAIGWDAEVSTPVYDVSDTSNNAYGRVYWYDNGRTTPVITGASNLKIINERLGPGAWAGQPAVPASTVNQQNTAWRDAAVSVKAGTVTAVVVDGVTVATGTGVTVIVPAGKNISITYSVAPTWAWTLL